MTSEIIAKADISVRSGALAASGGSAAIDADGDNDCAGDSAHNDVKGCIFLQIIKC